MTDFLQTRGRQEQAERERLSRFAVFSSQTRGRRHNEPEHTYRTCFQRDRDRVVHCAAFRRLEAKTQVFLDPASDYYRTRLTHTIEVAQIARTIARVLSVNEDLAEAASLAHDLGHPPYGHGGEAVLNELMDGHGGFEHNRQSLRTVEYLEHPYPAFRGLNLTYETRECLAKHETQYDHPVGEHEYGCGQAPLEGQIADIADAIAYNSHDLDDSLACGLIDEGELAGVELYQLIKHSVNELFPETKRFVRQLRCAKAVIDLLIVDALEESDRRLERFCPGDVDQVRVAPGKIVALSDACQNHLDKLQEFLLEEVYNHPDVARAQEKAGTELRYLFARYIERPSLLPERYQQRLDEQGPHRVVCDYIAGMTDRFCRRLYEQRI